MKTVIFAVESYSLYINRALTGCEGGYLPWNTPFTQEAGNCFDIFASLNHKLLIFLIAIGCKENALGNSCIPR